MRQLTCCLPLLLLAATSAGAEPISESDRKALESLAATNDAAFGTKDIATMAGQFAVDASVRAAPNAPVISGRESVLAFYKQIFDRRQGYARRITTLDHVELVGPDMALADVGVRIERRETEGHWALVRTFRDVVVAVREAGTWKLHSIRAFPQT